MGMGVIVVAVAACGGCSSAAGEASSASPKAETTMVLYAENRGIARIDNNAEGPSSGDLVHRELALSKTRAGAVIGDSYSQSEIVSYDPVAKTDMRRVDVQNSLPGGWLFLLGMSKLPIGSVPQPGWTDTYAVIGGTGEYAGAQGYERLLLLEDGKTFKLDITLLR